MRINKLLSLFSILLSIGCTQVIHMNNAKEKEVIYPFVLTNEYAEDTTSNEIFIIPTILSTFADSLVKERMYPVYPDVAFRAGLEGSVTVRILVRLDGKVKKTTIVKSDSLFNRNVLISTMRWSFYPDSCNSNGVAKIYETTEVFKFGGKDSASIIVR